MIRKLKLGSAKKDGEVEKGQEVLTMSDDERSAVSGTACWPSILTCRLNCQPQQGPVVAALSR